MIVACVLVNGNVPFGVEYVWRLYSMVRKHLRWDCRFVCFTDQPHRVEIRSGIEVIKIPTPPRGIPGWWSKLELFNPKHKLHGPGLYLDLDVLVVGDLQPIADYPSCDLVLIPTAGTFEGRAGKAVVKRYNSSIMRLEFGTTPGLWTNWRPNVCERLWGDQDWIGEQMPDCDMMPLAWFPRLSEIPEPPIWPRDAKVILCKRPKNHEAIKRWRWFDEAWR